MRHFRFILRVSKNQSPEKATADKDQAPPAGRSLAPAVIASLIIPSSARATAPISSTTRAGFLGIGLRTRYALLQFMLSVKCLFSNTTSVSNETVAVLGGITCI